MTLNTEGALIMIASMRSPFKPIAVGLLLFLPFDPATAQAAAGATPQEVERSAFRDATRAQARFESARLRSMPVREASRGRCDERIGRLCYWYDPNDLQQPAEEPASLASARLTLLNSLADARDRAPWDGWIVGQRVRYLLESGMLDTARMEAAACQAAEWWCGALRALVMHAEHLPAADSAFTDAIANSPPETRCEWTDLSILLDGDVLRRYRNLPCGSARDSANAVIWWLSRPLHTRDGNDFRAEYYARMTINTLQHNARNPYGMRWGEDLAELMLRYGWSRIYSRAPLRTGETSPLVTGHDHAASFSFLPSDQALLQPLATEPHDWEHAASRARARFAPVWATSIARPEAQLASFLRGDSALVVAIVRLPHDSSDAPWRAALAASAAAEEPTLRNSTSAVATHTTLTLHAPLRPLLVSLELLRQSAAVISGSGDSLPAYILRTAHFPPGQDGGSVSLSAPLLLEADDGMNASVQTSLSRVLSRALPSTTVLAPGKLGVFWETYGLPPGRSAADFSLVMHGGSRGWLARLRDRITRRTPAPPPLLSWSDILDTQGPGSDTPGVAAREVTIELPALAPGSYALELRMLLDDGSTVSAIRALHVRRPR
jgi:hypothetical protein